MLDNLFQRSQLRSVTQSESDPNLSQGYQDAQPKQQKPSMPMSPAKIQKIVGVNENYVAKS